MIDCGFFYNTLIKSGIGFFVGVPNSLLKSFCGYVTDNVGSNNHLIAANEGGAIALACGYHLATGQGAKQRIDAIISECGLQTRLSQLGVNSTEDIETIIANGFNPDRVTNNPRRVTKRDLRKILEMIY